MVEGRRKTMVGRVVSDKMEKTVTVEVATLTRHRLYGKTIRRIRRFKAHNEEPKAKAGDTVRIVESRPLSRTKRWRVAEIVQAGEVLEVVRDVELESLVEAERAAREQRKEEERRRAADRLQQLAGQPGGEAELTEAEEDAEGEFEEADDFDQDEEAE